MPTVEELAARIQQLEARLNNIGGQFDDNQTIRAGNVLLLNNEADTDGDPSDVGQDPEGNTRKGTGFFASKIGRVFAEGTFNAGTAYQGALQAGFNTAGKLIAGAGNVTLDADGLTITAPGAGTQTYNKIKFGDSLMAIYGSKVTSPESYTMTIAAGDAASGDATVVISADADSSSGAGSASIGASGSGETASATFDTTAGISISAGTTLPVAVTASNVSFDAPNASFGGIVGMPGRAYYYMLDFPHEFMTIAQQNGWGATAIGAGTRAAIASSANHPGVVRFTQNGANTGYQYDLGDNNPTNILLGGGEVYECIFSLPTATATVERLGFQDSITTTAPVDGAWINIAATTLSGKTSNNSTVSTTATTHTVSTGTWYRAVVYVNSTSLVTFTLYTCSDGAVVWTNTLTTNIPSAAGRETSVGTLAYKTTAGTANLLDVDWHTYYNLTALTR